MAGRQEKGNVAWEREPDARGQEDAFGRHFCQECVAVEPTDPIFDANTGRSQH